MENVKVVEETRDTGSDTAVLDSNDVASLSDDDLSKRLSGVKEEPKEDAKEAATEEPAKDEAEESESQEKDAAKPADTFDAKTEIQKLQRQIEEKQKMIDRQASEIGEFRKSLQKPAEPMVEEDANEIIAKLDKPGEFRKEIANIVMKVLQEEKKAEDAKRDEEKRAVSNIRNAISQKVADFNDLVPFMGDICLESGDAPESVEEFKRDPFRLAIGNPTAFNSLVIAARERKKAKDLEVSIVKGNGRKVVAPSKTGVNGRGGTKQTKGYVVPNDTSDIPDDVLNELLTRQNNE